MRAPVAYRHRHPLLTRRLPVAAAIASLFAGPVLGQTPPTVPITLPVLKSSTSLPPGVSGIVYSGRTPGYMTVTTTTNRVVIPWASFSVGAGNTVRFEQPDSSSAVLNRVTTSNTPSAIDGTLSSNGRVYLINPAGISFGAGSQVDVGGLVASTLDMDDSAFINGTMHFKGASSNGRVVNSGTVRTHGGPLALLGSSVETTSVSDIQTAGGDIVLAATSADTSLVLANNHLSVDMGGAPAGAVKIDGKLYTRVTSDEFGTNNNGVKDGGTLVLQTSQLQLGTGLSVDTSTQVQDGAPGQVEVRNTILKVAAQGGTISGADVVSLLAANDVKLTGTSTLDAVVDDAIAWPSAPAGASHALTLSSGGNLLIRNTIDATANGAQGRVALEIGQALPAAGSTATDDFALVLTGTQTNLDPSFAFTGRINLPSGLNLSIKRGSDGDTQLYKVITTPGELRESPGALTALGADIDWKPENGSFNPLQPVAPWPLDQGPGHYDGLGHSVSGLRMSGDTNVGMFSSLSGTEVRNLALRDAAVECYKACGVLAGTAGGGTRIRSVTVDRSTLTGHAVTDPITQAQQAPMQFGGLVGVMDGASVSQGYVTHTDILLPEGSSVAGGLVGFMTGGATVADSSTARGLIQGIGGTSDGKSAPDLSALGGFVGVVDPTSTIVRSASVTSQIAYGDWTRYNDPPPSGGGPALLQHVPGTGGFAGVNAGLISDSQVYGPNITLKRNGSILGGFVGTNLGQISNSRVTAPQLIAGYTEDNAMFASAVGGFAGAGQRWTSGLEPWIANSSVTNIMIQQGPNSAGLGGFIGVNREGHLVRDSSASVINISIDGSETSQRQGGSGGVGGFVGILESGVIQDSSAFNFTFNLGTDLNGVGGFAGRIGPASGTDSAAKVSRSYAEGAVPGGRLNQVGGFAGVVAGTIDNAYFNGKVTAAGTKVGGFAGENRGTIDRTYTDSQVPSGAAAFVADNSNGTITLSHYNSTRAGGSPVAETGDTSGIDALTATQMKQQANFPQWDFRPNGIWYLYEGHTDPLFGHMMSQARMSLTGPSKTVTYNGQAQTLTGKPTIAVTLPDGSPGDPNLVLGTSLINRSGADNINAGDYVYDPVGFWSPQRGYLFTVIDTVPGKLTIDKATLQVTVNDAPAKTYDGQKFTGGNGVSYSGFVNGETDSVVNTSKLTYGGNAQGAVDAGTYSITAQGLDATNYAFTYVKDGKLTINKAQLTVTAQDVTKIYNGQNQTGDGALTYAGFQGNDDRSQLTGTLVMDGGGINAGTHPITPSGLSSSNYDITFNDGTLTINKAQLTVAANDLTKTYDGKPFSGGNGVSFSGFVNGEDVSVVNQTNLGFSGSSQGAKNASPTPYTITPRGLAADNYDFTYQNGKLTINKAQLTVAANDLTKTYDGTAFSGGNGVSFSGFVNGEDVSVVNQTKLGFSGSSQGAKNASASPYTITPQGLAADNYDFTYQNGKLTINKAQLTVTANDLTKTYDGTAFSGGNGVSYTGFVNGEDVSVVNQTNLGFSGSSQGAKNASASPYTITPQGLAADNYDFSYQNGKLTINKAQLTVTAQDVTKIYNGQNQTGDGALNYAGFQGGDGPSQLTGNLAMAGGGRVVGHYGITPSGLSSGNYDINFEDGTLTIQKAPLTITADSLTTTYNGQPQSGPGTVKYEGLVAGDREVTLGVAGSGTDAGTYDLVPSDLTLASRDATHPSTRVNSDNYDVTYVKGKLIINKVPVQVFVNDAPTRIYDGKAFNGGNGLGYSGFIHGEDSSVVDTSHLQYGGSAQGARNAGQYLITAQGLSATNYMFDYVKDGNLVIDRAPLTVTANNDAKPFDGVPFSGGHGVTYAGFVPGEGREQLAGTLAYTGNSQGAVQPGVYRIVPSGQSSPNYLIQYLPGTLEVTAAAITPPPLDAPTLERLTDRPLLQALPTELRLCIEPEFVHVDAEDRAQPRRQACRRPDQQHGS